MSSLRIAVLKRDFLSAGLPTFSGGKHAFRCLARSLAAAGLRVTVLCEATPAQVMLSFVEEASSAAGRVALMGPERLCEGAVQFQSKGCSVVACDFKDSPGMPISMGVETVMKADPQVLFIDADELYSQKGDDDAVESWARALSHAVGRSTAMLVILVQNVHFLPFGPAGCCRPGRHVLELWRSAQAFFCVSQFVADYVARWSADISCSHTPARLVSLSAFGVYGDGPFPDIGSQVSARMSDATCRPVVIMPKLSDVKGASIFFELAAMFPQVTFVGVAGDAGRWREQRSALENVQLQAPGDIGAVLAEGWVMLCPSIWLEAWGMVAVEGLLRGLPVLSSDAGGLPEAKLGTNYVLPVNPIQMGTAAPAPVESAEPLNPAFESEADLAYVSRDRASSGGAAGDAPTTPRNSTPRWGDRIVPPQDIAPWASALRALLVPEAYSAESRLSRTKALDHVSRGPEALRAFIRALQAMVEGHGGA